MPRPTPAEVLDAIATVLESTATAGEVVRDPKYTIDPKELAEMIMGTGATVDGWVVEAGPEQPESRNRPNGTEQLSTFIVTGMLSVGSGSLAAFGVKMEEAKQAFRDGANENLGFGAAGCRQRFLFAPDGWTRLQLDNLEVHYVRMEIPVWTANC